MAAARANHFESGNRMFAMLIAVVLVGIMIISAVPMDTVNTSSSVPRKAFPATTPARPAPATRAGPLVEDMKIIDVMFDPYGADAGNEYVTLLNNGSADVKLSSWVITNKDGAEDAVLPAWTLSPGVVLTVHFGWGVNDADLTDYTGSYYTQNKFAVFNNTCDAVALYNGTPSATTIRDFFMWSATEVDINSSAALGQAIDAGLWTDGDHFNLTAEPVAEGESVGMRSSVKDTDTSANWGTGRLVLNEVMLTPRAIPFDSEFVEIFNIGPGAVALYGYTLKTGSKAVSLPNTVMPSHSYLMVKFDPENENEDRDISDLYGQVIVDCGAPVLGSSGDIGLYGPSGIKDYMAWAGASYAGSALQTDAVAAGIWTSGQYVNVAGFTAGETFGRDQSSTDTNTISDWALHGGPFANGPTPGFKNSYNIFVWNASVTGAAGTEWIEIMNFGANVSINGWKVLDGRGNELIALPNWVMPRGSLLRVTFGPGTDDNNFTDDIGAYHLASAPSAKLFNATFDAVIITSGTAATKDLVSLDIFAEGKLTRAGNDEKMMELTLWNPLSWAQHGLVAAVEYVQDTGAYVAEKFAQYQQWAIDWVKELIIGDYFSKEVSLGDLITITFQVDPFEGTWTFTVDVKAPTIEIPLSNILIGLKLKISFSGKIEVRGGAGQPEVVTEAKIKISFALEWGTTIKDIVSVKIGAQFVFTLKYESEAKVVDGKEEVTATVTFTIVFEIYIKAKWGERDLVDCKFPWTLYKYFWTDKKPKDQKPPVDRSKPEVTPYPGSDDGCSGEIKITNTDYQSHKLKTVSRGDVPMKNGGDPNFATSDTYTSPMIASEGSYDLYYWTTQAPVGNFHESLDPNITTPPPNLTAAPCNSIRYNFTVCNDHAGPLEVSHQWINISATDNASYFNNLTMDIPWESMTVLAKFPPTWYVTAVTDSSAGRANAMSNAIYWTQFKGYWPIAEFANFQGEKTVQTMIHVAANWTGTAPVKIDFAVVSNLYPGTGVSQANLQWYNMHNDTTCVNITPASSEKRSQMWAEDFEGSVDEWNATGDWKIGTRTLFTDSPPSDDGKIAAIRLDANYSQGLESVLTSPELDLSGHSWVNLNFWVYYDFSYDFWTTYLGNWWDFADCYVINEFGTYRIDSWNGGTSFYNNFALVWSNFTYDITDHATAHTKIRFVFHSANETSVGNDKHGFGLLLDNLTIVSKELPDDVAVINSTPLQANGQYAPGSKDVKATIKNVGNFTADNVTVHMYAKNAGTVMAQEGFEGTPTFANTGTGSPTWAVTNALAHTGNKSAAAYGSMTRGNSSLLASAQYDTTTPMALSFYYTLAGYGGYADLELLFSTDGGANWNATPIWDSDAPTNGAWVQVTAALPSSATLKVAFRLNVYDIAGLKYCAVDDLKISPADMQVDQEYTELILSLAPGQEVEVNFTHAFTATGAWEVVWWAQYNKDFSRSNNWLHIPFEITGTPTVASRFITPADDATVTGITEVTVASSYSGVSAGKVTWASAADAGLVGTSDDMSGPATFLFNFTALLFYGQVTLTADFFAGGIAVDQAVITVTISNPQAVFMPNFTYAQDGLVAFTQTSVFTSGHALAYHWTLGEGTDCVLEDPSHLYLASGDYNVTLTVTGSGYVVKSVSKLITVEGVGFIGVDFAFTPAAPTDLDLVAFNDTSNLTGQDLGALEWAWDFGDGNTSDTQNATHTFGDDGVYTVTLTISKGPVSWSKAKDLTVLNVGPTADFTFTASGNNLTFTDASVDLDGSVVNWTWNFGDGSSGYGDNVTHAYAAAGFYNVSLSASDDDSNVSIVTKTVGTEGLALLGSVSGHVTYSDSNPTRVKATITLTSAKGTTYTAATDAAGNYTIASVPYGTYNASCAVTGYTTQTKTGVVVDGAEVLDFTLSATTGPIIEKDIDLIPGTIVKDSLKDPNTGSTLATITASGNGTITVRFLTWAEVSSMVGPIPDNLAHLNIFLMVTLQSGGTLDWIYLEAPYKDVNVPDTTNEATLKMYYYDAAATKWTAASGTSVDTTANLVWANVTHLTIFAPLEEKTVTVDDDDDDTGLSMGAIIGIIAGIIILVIIVVIIVVFVMRRKKPEEDAEGEKKEDEEAEEKEEADEESEDEEEGEAKEGEEAEEAKSEPKEGEDAVEEGEEEAEAKDGEEAEEAEGEPKEGEEKAEDASEETSSHLSTEGHLEGEEEAEAKDEEKPDDDEPEEEAEEEEPTEEDTDD